MKRTLLASAVALASLWAQAQVSTMVLQPADLAGPLNFTIADDWGATPDMNDPLNRIQAFTVIGRDNSSTADSLGCDALVNGAEVAGKIAMIYRGACNFSTKALNAQNAGAIGVVLINNNGAPIGMAAGDDGASVTIPVVMISQGDGADLHNQVVAGNVEMMIGTIAGMFANNLAMKTEATVIPTQAARPAQVSTTSGEFSTQLGGWVYNNGNDAQANVTLKATVTHNGSTVYDETSTPQASLSSGDSIYIALPDFSQNGYTGRYEFTYSTQSDQEESFDIDNSYSTTLSFDSLLSYSPLNSAGLPSYGSTYYRSGTGGFQACSYFKDANASRLMAEGMYAAALRSGSANIAGTLLKASTYAWNDDVDGFSTISFNTGSFQQLQLLVEGEYIFNDSLEAGQMVYIPFFEPAGLQDNQKYLFCVSTVDADIYLSFTGDVDYNETINQTDAISTLFAGDDGNWYAGFSDLVGTWSMGVLMKDNLVGIQDVNRVELTPYPNPTANSISIPMMGQSGKATVQVYDNKGAKVADRQVTVGGNQVLTMDLGSLDAGLYTFKVDFEGGAHSSFRVALTK